MGRRGAPVVSPEHPRQVNRMHPCLLGETARGGRMDEVDPEQLLDPPEPRWRALLRSRSVASCSGDEQLDGQPVECQKGEVVRRGQLLGDPSGERAAPGIHRRPGAAEQRAPGNLAILLEHQRLEQHHPCPSGAEPVRVALARGLGDHRPRDRLLDAVRQLLPEAAGDDDRERRMLVGVPRQVERGGEVGDQRPQAAELAARHRGASLRDRDDRSRHDLAHRSSPAAGRCTGRRLRDAPGRWRWWRRCDRGRPCRRR